MKKLLLTPLILLAACAPALNAVQGTNSTLTTASQILTFRNADPLPAMKVVVAVDSASLSDVRCAAPRDGVTVCKLGDVAAGANVSLPYSGVIVNASATWRTPADKLRAIALSR